MKELNNLFVSDRKQKIVTKRPELTKQNSANPKVNTNTSINKEELDNNINEDIWLTKRRRRTSIAQNKDLLAKFENIMNSMSNLIYSMQDNFDYENQESNSQQLSDFFKIMRIFAKDEDNIVKMAEYVILIL